METATATSHTGVLTDHLLRGGLGRASSPGRPPGLPPTGLPRVRRGSRVKPASDPQPARFGR